MLIIYCKIIWVLINLFCHRSCYLQDIIYYGTHYNYKKKILKYYNFFILTDVAEFNIGVSINKFLEFFFFFPFPFSRVGIGNELSNRWFFTVTSQAGFHRIFWWPFNEGLLVLFKNKKKTKNKMLCFLSTMKQENLLFGWLARTVPDQSKCGSKCTFWGPKLSSMEVWSPTFISD